MFRAQAAEVTNQGGQERKNLNDLDVLKLTTSNELQSLDYEPQIYLQSLDNTTIERKQERELQHDLKIGVS